IVGAACVGPWEDLPQVRQAVHRQQRLWPWQRRRFRQTGSLWPAGSSLGVAQWPGSSIICSCRAIAKQVLTDLVDAGMTDPDDLAEKSGASTACGSCRALVCQLAGAPAETVKVPAAAAVLVSSLIGLLVAAALLLLPPLPFADSVQASWRKIDVLWRSDLARQITGFSLLGLLAVALIFSLRKRTGWFRWGSYGLWRGIHAILGTLLLVAVGVHTGLRLGTNLNFLLSSIFIATAAIGTLAGISSSLENRVDGQAAVLLRRWRPRITALHLCLFWPVPILIGFHIFSFYWFTD
ncbi:MAG: (2Fe-2S)-binding protein, partial [Pirellulales bacterium]|nr:(2Fe-2S)-binding protein [Pirellulales bacterium]